METPGLEISFLFRRVRDDVMTATKREQQPFVYGSLSKEEIYLRAPAANVQAPSASAPVAATSAEDEAFWQAIQTSTVAGLYEEFLIRYPRSNHAPEGRQRIKDFKAKEVAALSPPAAVAKPETDGNRASDAKPLDRNLFTAEDSQKIAAIAATQQLNLPNFTIPPGQDDPLNANSKFVGVWSSKRGWGNGKGRYGMMIVAEVSATGLARGYFVWGPPTNLSWGKDAAGYKSFAEYVVNDKFSISGTQVTVKLDKNVLALSSFKKDKPSETSRIDLRPVWQLVSARDNVEPSARRERAAQPRAARHENTIKSNTLSSVGAATMEDRYRACKKLVRGFARREACARNGTI
jgi:hypothetical protein